MHRNRLLIVAIGLLLLICKLALYQHTGNGVDKALQVPSSIFNKVNQKATRPKVQLKKQAAKHRKRFMRTVGGIHMSAANAGVGLFATPETDAGKIGSEKEYTEILNAVIK